MQQFLVVHMADGRRLLMEYDEGTSHPFWGNYQWRATLEP